MKVLESAHKDEIEQFLHKWEKIIIPEFENEQALMEIELS